jgi:hypothetical protein
MFCVHSCVLYVWVQTKYSVFYFDTTLNEVFCVCITLTPSILGLNFYNPLVRITKTAIKNFTQRVTKGIIDVSVMAQISDMKMLAIHIYTYRCVCVCVCVSSCICTTAHKLLAVQFVSNFHHLHLKSEAQVRLFSQL